MGGRLVLVLGKTYLGAQWIVAEFRQDVQE